MVIKVVLSVALRCEGWLQAAPTIPLNVSLIVHDFAIMQQEVVKQKASSDNHVGIFQLTLDSRGQQRHP
jgi:hypothetical protein